MSLLGLRTCGDSISEDAFKWRADDGKFRYGELDKEMFAVTKTRISPEDYRLRPGEHFVTSKVWKTEDGTQHSHFDHFLAVPLPPADWALTEKRIQPARGEAERDR